MCIPTILFLVATQYLIYCVIILKLGSNLFHIDDACHTFYLSQSPKCHPTQQLILQQRSNQTTLFVGYFYQAKFYPTNSISIEFEFQNMLFLDQMVVNLNVYIQIIMSYQYKKSSILYELEQAIKKKVAEKPKTREVSQKNVQGSIEKRKVLNQRQSVQRLPSKQKQVSKVTKQQNFSLFNNENLLQVQAHHTDSKFSEHKKINNRKIDKLFSLINYALSSADKAMKYINYANFEGEFAVKLFKSDKQNLMNEMRNLTPDDLTDSCNRDQSSNKVTMPSIIILQQENLKLKKELAILERQNQRNRSGGQPKDMQLTLLLREIEIQKYKESVYRIKGHDFLERLSNIVQKQLKYENLLRKGHASATQFDSIFRSLISERNNLCKEASSSKTHQEQPHSEQQKINKIRQQKQQLMKQIQICKKKLGEITEISVLKSDLEVLHKQNDNIYKILSQKLPEQPENAQLQLPQLLMKALNSGQCSAQHQLESQLHVLQAQNQILQKEVQSKQQSIRNLDRQLANSKQQISEAKKREKKAQENLAEAEKQNEYLIGKVEELEEKIGQYQKEQEGERDNQENIKEQNSRLKEMQVSMKSQIDELTKKLEENESYINELHTRMTEINQEHAVERERVMKKYEQKLELLGSSKDKIVSQLQKDNQKLKNSSQGIQEKQAELNQCKLSIKKYSLQLLQMQGQMQELQQQYEALNQQNRQNQSSLKLKQKQLQEQSEKLEQTKAFLKQKTKQNFSKINETNSLQQNNKQLLAKFDACQTLISELKQKQEQYLSRIEELEENQKRMKGLESELAGSKQKIQHLEEQLKDEQQKEKVESQKAIKMESKLEKKLEELNEKQAEILDKEYNLKQRQQALNQRDNAIKQKEYQLTELSQQLGADSSQLKALQVELEELRSSNEERISQLQQKASELSKRQILLNENISKLALKQTDLLQREQNLVEGQGKIEQLEAIISSLENEKTSLLEQMQKINNSFDNEKLLSAQKEKLLRQSIDDLQANLTGLIEREQELLRTKQGIEKKYLATKQQKIIAEDQLEEMKEKLDEMETALKNSQDRISVLEGMLQSNKGNQNVLSDLSQENKTLKQQLIRLEKQLGQKISSANKKQTVLLERCGMLDQELIIKAQALDQANEQQASLEAQNLSKHQKISQLQSRLMKKDLDNRTLIEQVKDLKQNVGALSQMVQEKQRQIADMKQNPPVPLKSDAEQQNLRRLLDTIQNMEEQIEEYSNQEEQRQKQKDHDLKMITQLQQQLEQRKAESSQIEEKYAEVVLKLELTLINMEQVLEEKDKLDDRVKQLSDQLDVVLENNKHLQQWKNIQIMYEKQYCNLIKRILRAIIDLDELGNVDEMGIRTLLELGSQKVIEHRMRVRDQESNEKKMRKEPADQTVQTQQSDQKKEQTAAEKEALFNPFNSKEQISQPEHPEIMKENLQQENDGSLKDIHEFDNVEEGINNSLISEDLADSESEIPEKQVNQVIFGQNNEIKQEEANQEEEDNKNELSPNSVVNVQKTIDQQQVQMMKVELQPSHGIQKAEQNVQRKEEQDHNIENLEDFGDYESEKLNQSMMSNPNIEGESKSQDKDGLGFDEFNNFNQSELDSSLMSDTGRQNQHNKNQQHSNAEESNKIPAVLQKQEAHAQQKTYGMQNAKDGHQSDRQHIIGMDLSQISQGQPATQPHNNSMQFENFLDFQTNGLNESMISEKQQGNKNNQEMNNFNDFNDMQSQKLNESMLSEQQIKVQKSEEQQVQVAEKKSENSQTNPMLLDMDNFDDFNSEKMNDSIISNQEGVANSPKNNKQQSNQANFDEFGEFKADEMNSSLLSDKDIIQH